MLHYDTMRYTTNSIMNDIMTWQTQNRDDIKRTELPERTKDAASLPAGRNMIDVASAACECVFSFAQFCSWAALHIEH